MNTYRTSEIARLVGVHPNTVRFYEEMELIPKPDRKPNGYRIYTDIHLEQLKLLRIAFRTEVLQNGLRKRAVEIVKAASSGNYERAIELTNDYLRQIELERENAEEAIEIASLLLSGNKLTENNLYLTRKETADYLGITMDTLRNWEMNGLLTVKRKQNGYRVYTDDDIQRLKIIRSLRCANYSLVSILRMLTALSANSNIDVRKVIDTPQDYEHTDNIIATCDRLLTSLQSLNKDTRLMLDQLETMRKQFN